MSVSDLNADDRLVIALDRKAEMQKFRFHLVPFEEIQLGREPLYLVKGILPRIGLAVIWGPPKSGKSFWTFDLAMHVALGQDYRGRRVQPGAVVYCAFEGQSGISARVEAFRKTFPIDMEEPVPFFLEPVTVDLIADRYGAALKDNDGKQYSRPIATTELARAVAGRLVRKMRLARPRSGRAQGFDGPIRYPRHSGVA